MGWYHQRVILFDWCEPSVKADDVDAEVKRLALRAYEEARIAWEKRIGRETSYTVEEFLKDWSGPKGGGNGDYQAAFFASGTKGGRHLYNAMSRLIELAKLELVPMKVGVAVITTYSESFYEAGETATIDYDSRAEENE